MGLLAVALVAPNAMAASNPPSSVDTPPPRPRSRSARRSSATARCPKNAPQVTDRRLGGTGVQPERHRHPRR